MRRPHVEYPARRLQRDSAQHCAAGSKSLELGLSGTLPSNCGQAEAVVPWKSDAAPLERCLESALIVVVRVPSAALEVDHGCSFNPASLANSPRDQLMP